MNYVYWPQHQPESEKSKPVAVEQKIPARVEWQTKHFTFKQINSRKTNKLNSMDSDVVCARVTIDF